MEGKCTNQPYLVLMQASKSIQERIRIEIIKIKLALTEFSVFRGTLSKGKADDSADWT